MTCDDYRIDLGDYADDSLQGARLLVVEKHLQTCAHCRGLVVDFRTIRAAARTLEPQTPSPEVWRRIAAGIDSRTDPSGFWATISAFSSWRPAAAAAALVMVLGGSAWLAWWDVASRQRQQPPVALESMLTANDPKMGEPIESELQHTEETYSLAIASLEQISKTDATALDGATADVLQQNLAVIDEAIGQSRAALAAEPASDTAQESLLVALGSKMALLEETVALINETHDERAGSRIDSGLRQ